MQALNRMLSIGELADHTGLSPATLRMWESRHGFPEAHRLESGHRRYDEQTVERVRAVLARQAAGVRLDVAIAESGTSPSPSAPSVYAELRRAQPELVPLVLRKSSLVAISHAIEDECASQARRAVLFGAFQHERHLRGSRARWEDIAATARAAFVFTRGQHAHLAGSALVHVPLAESDPMRREWSLVCDGTDQPAALSAWELPGQTNTPDRDRLFEAIWTLDPAAVRSASLTCAALAADAGVEEAVEIVDSLSPPSMSQAGTAASANRLFLRVVSYMEQGRLR
jgi:DICT domain-containing protein